MSLLFFAGNGIIKHQSVYDAMRSVDRRNFCKGNPYMDAPQGIGYSVTISAPHMVSSFCCVCRLFSEKSSNGLPVFQCWSFFHKTTTQTDKSEGHPIPGVKKKWFSWFVSMHTHLNCWKNISLGTIQELWMLDLAAVTWRRAWLWWQVITNTVFRHPADRQLNELCCSRRTDFSVHQSFIFTK